VELEALQLSPPPSIYRDGDVRTPIIPTFLFPLSLMPDIDSSGLYLSALGFIPKIRFLLPRNVIPPVSALLNETRQLLDHAETIGAILPQSECRTRFDR
jgi:hypothetical protein